MLNLQEKYVFVRKDVLDKIQKFVSQEGFKTESGGLLLGSWREQHLEITDCTFPAKKDIRSYTSFTRKDLKHNKIAKLLWKNSNKKIGFIGEWHTHPENYPNPSGIDKNSWTKLQLDQKDKNMFFIIVGMKDIWTGYTEITACYIKITETVLCENNMSGSTFCRKNK